jgi:hypothetical protein
VSALEDRSDFMAGVERRLTKLSAPRRMPSIGDATFARSLECALECVRTNDWSLAYPREFVAHYAHLHERVYGIAPGELTPKARVMAAALVSRVLDKEFGGDKNLLASYARWVWNREKPRHDRRAARGEDVFRISWKFAFSARMITDWRMATGGKP